MTWFIFYRAEQKTEMKSFKKKKEKNLAATPVAIINIAPQQQDSVPSVFF